MFCKCHKLRRFGIGLTLISEEPLQSELFLALVVLFLRAIYLVDVHVRFDLLGSFI